jgi:hypothetical protein
VKDGLRSPGPPSGFSLLHHGKEIGNAIYWIDLEENRVLLRTSIPMDGEYELDLYYGYGATSYCTIIDGADRSLPAFGPRRILLTPLVVKERENQVERI